MVISPRMQSQYKEETSIKLCIYPRLEPEHSDASPPPVIFTCDGTIHNRIFIKVYCLTRYIFSFVPCRTRNSSCYIRTGRAFD